MIEDDEPDSVPPVLACGHLWDGPEDWDDMAVILKASLDGPGGPQPATSTGHACKACRAAVEGKRFSSMAEANEWLRQASQ